MPSGRSDVLIRAAVRGDADAITDVQVSSWRAGYAEVLPESVLYADDFDAMRRRFWNNWRFDAGHRVAVACSPTDAGERVIGFCSYGPERARARGFTGRGEIWAFYLDPEAWGSGVADDLMEHVELRLQSEGFATAVLWVLERNPRARRFYERHGWAETGLSANYDAGHDVSVVEIEYRKDL